MPAPRTIDRKAPACRSRRGGFSIVELLIIVLIIAAISVIVIPLFLDTLDVSKQKRTMADINLIGKALMSWTYDQVGAAAAGAVTVPIDEYGAPLTRADIEELLVPQYAPTVPGRDAWGGEIEYRINLDELTSDRLMAIRSAGRDGEFSTDTYTSGAFAPAEFSQDIVWVDGTFVRWPEKN